MAHNTLVCPEAITPETLSRWRDAGLPADEAQRLEAHVADCAACRRILAEYDTVTRALRSQRELEPGDRIVSGVFSRAAQKRVRRSASRRRLLSGLGALAAVFVLVALFAAVLGTHLVSGPIGRPTQTASKSTTPAPTANATPSGSFSPVAGYLAAWGAHAVTTTASMTIDATHLFTPTTLAPDTHTLPYGRTLLGYMTMLGSNPNQEANVQAGYFDPTTRQFTGIGVYTRVNPPQCCSDDGRFIVAIDSNSPGETCGACHVRYWAYDLQTRRLRQVAVGSQFQQILGGWLSHGLLILNTGEGVQVADLAAGTITPLAGTSTNTQYFIDTFSWPYLIYEVSSANTQPSTIRLRNMATGQDTTFPALQSFVAAHSGLNTQSMSLMIAGDTIFASVLTGQNYLGPNSSGNGVSTLYALDHALSGGAQWRTLATFNGDLGGISGANGRLIVCGNTVWDMTLRTFVTFPPFSGTGPNMQSTGASLAIPGLAGNILAVAQGSEAAETVLFFDTSQLPSGRTPGSAAAQDDTAHK